MLDKYGTKTLRADRLIELLQSLPPDSRIGANRVGNLLVWHPDDHLLAFIDMLLDGEVEYWETEQSSSESSDGT